LSHNHCLGYKNYEKGLITSNDTNGLELRFGHEETLLLMVEKITHRQDFGYLLAEGSAIAATKLGSETEKLLVTSKSQEFPAHMPQLKRSLALIYAVNPFGADHMSHEHDPLYRQCEDRLLELNLTNPQPDHVLNKEKVLFALTTQFNYSCLDTFNLCALVYGPTTQLYGPQQIAELVHAITGWEVNLQELQRMGERMLNLLRVFNAREGFKRENDRLPVKVEEPLLGGPSDGLHVSLTDVEQAKDIYCAMAEWDVRTGLPTAKKLRDLEIEWAIDFLPDA
jgi:aldehyde:ferredoxin oxidoreductase